MQNHVTIAEFVSFRRNLHQIETGILKIVFFVTNTIFKVINILEYVTNTDFLIRKK